MRVNWHNPPGRRGDLLNCLRKGHSPPQTQQAAEITLELKIITNATRHDGVLNVWLTVARDRTRAVLKGIELGYI